MPYLNENNNKDGIMPESDRASNDGIMPERFSENANTQSSRLKADEQIIAGVDSGIKGATYSKSPTILTDLISRVIASSGWIAFELLGISIEFCVFIFIHSSLVDLTYEYYYEYYENECRFMIATSIVTIVFSLISFVEFADNFKIEFAKNRLISVIKAVIQVLLVISLILYVVFACLIFIPTEYDLAHLETFEQVFWATWMTVFCVFLLVIIAWGDWLYDATHILSKKIRIIFRVVFIISAIVVMICGCIHGYAELEKAESQMTAQYALDDGRVYEDAVTYDYEKMDLIASDI